LRPLQRALRSELHSQAKGDDTDYAICCHWDFSSSADNFSALLNAVMNAMNRFLESEGNFTGAGEAYSAAS
jgi:hypothetical protein